MAKGELTIIGSGATGTALTATGTAGPVDAHGAVSGVFMLLVSAVTGTSPTLDVWLQHSVDGGTTWDDFGHFTQSTAAATRVAHVSFHSTAGVLAGFGLERAAQAKASTAGVFRDGAIGGLVRAAYTIAGTSPSFTVALTAYFVEPAE